MTIGDNGVPPPIRRMFNDIHAALPETSVKEFPATAGKLGLRVGSSVVVFTYNSYRKGWLDTSVQLGPKLCWFAFRPTHNKPDQYWAAELSAERVEEIYRANRVGVLAVLADYLGLQVKYR